MRRIGTRTKWSVLAVGVIAVAASTVAVGAGGGNGGVLVPLAPERVLDTREPGAQFGRLGSGQTKTLDFGDFVPAGADAVELNVTVVGGSAASHLRIWPHGEAKPATSAINWSAGATVGNGLSMKLGTDQSVEFFNKQGSVDVIVDLMGYFVDEAAGTTGPQGPKGAKGAKGDPGVSGLVVINATKSFPAGVQTTVTANCPAGKTVLSGGFDIESNIGSFDGAGLFTGPNVTTGWKFEGTSSGSSQNVTVFAVCATVAP